MIVKKFIEHDLRRLDRLYREATGSDSARLQVFASKLAVIELSGWVEESFDKVAFRAIKGRINTPAFQSRASEAIKRNYGFDYSDNFCRMMANLIGVPELEALDDHLRGTGGLMALEAELSALNTQRRTAAHTHLGGVQRNYDAPSYTLGRLGRTYPPLRSMYSWFCR